MRALIALLCLSVLMTAQLHAPVACRAKCPLPAVVFAPTALRALIETQTAYSVYCAPKASLPSSLGSPRPQTVPREDFRSWLARLSAPTAPLAELHQNKEAVTASTYVT